MKLLGVEAGGDGIDTPRHSATLTAGSKGVLHGVRTYILQNEQRQAVPFARFRAKFVAATDAEAFIGFRLMSQLEGIIPALESAHGIYGAIELAKTMKKGEDIVICLSGRGDKDVQSVADELPVLGPKIGWDLRF